MKYIALLRGINVGGKNMISMKAIVPMFESMGFKEVSTYINTGNIFFEVDGSGGSGGSGETKAIDKVDDSNASIANGENDRTDETGQAFANNKTDKAKASDKADARSETQETHTLALTERIYEGLQDAFNLDIPVLVKEMDEIKAIADAIPADWTNKENVKSDVAYLFPSIDSPDVVEALPFTSDYIRIIYTKGALLWSLNMTDYSKSRLNKLVGSKLYASMTVRNVNTASLLGIAKDISEIDPDYKSEKEQMIHRKYGEKTCFIGCKCSTGRTFKPKPLVRRCCQNFINGRE
ncbi:MAG: DUF1697 domain-containing protein [Balneolales bacterium]|nr:DUF1697 domain-containing protein [Balneolales bacterium]